MYIVLTAILFNLILMVFWGDMLAYLALQKIAEKKILPQYALIISGATAGDLFMFLLSDMFVNSFFITHVICSLRVCYI